MRKDLVVLVVNVGDGVCYEFKVGGSVVVVVVEIDDVGCGGGEGDGGEEFLD